MRDGLGQPLAAVLRLSAALLPRFDSRVAGGRVLSVHASAVNLAWADGGIVAIHGPGELAAPFAASVSHAERLRQLAPGHPATCREGAISIGNLAWAWRQAAVADVQMPRRPLPLPAPALLAAVQPECAGSALAGGLAGQERAALARGIAERDAALVAAAACGLIGLGPGLTPSGDDCLVGALAVLYRLDARWLAGLHGLRDIIEDARARTTAVAAAFLHHALDGLFAEPVLRLLEAETPVQARRAARDLRGHGATSGADTLTGISLALAALPGVTGFRLRRSRRDRRRRSLIAVATPSRLDTIGASE